MFEATLEAERERERRLRFLLGLLFLFLPAACFAAYRFIAWMIGDWARMIIN